MIPKEAGCDIIRNETFDAFRRFLDLNEAPVCKRTSGKGILPKDRLARDFKELLRHAIAAHLRISKDKYDMNDGTTQTILATWAAKGLPARLDVTATARLLGFAEHDIQILMAAGKLSPLGDPAPNAPKWFAAVELIRLATDCDWLHKATKEIAKYWRHMRERRQSMTPTRTIL